MGVGAMRAERGTGAEGHTTEQQRDVSVVHKQWDTGSRSRQRRETQEVRGKEEKGELTYPGGKVWLICPRSSSMTHAIGMTMIERGRERKRYRLM
jgi:hypothetical protein